MVILLLGVQACAVTSRQSGENNSLSEQTADPEITASLSVGVSLANPASVYCEENGGTLEIRLDAQGGEYGVCMFPDGSECEEWAFMRGECQPSSDIQAVSTPIPARYTNTDYGFSVDPPAIWAIETYDDHLIMSDGSYRLFIGFSRTGEEVPIFRTGMPSGDFIDGGTYLFLGEERPKQLLVAEGRIKLVDFATRMLADNLVLSIWLEPDPNDPNLPTDYREWDLPIEVIQTADDVLFTFMLID